VSHPVAGTFETVATPFTVHGASIRPRGPGPEVGADTAAVLRGRLHLSQHEIDELVARRVVGSALVLGTPIARWTAQVHRAKSKL
jgi:crotonobetainyl-CoA:carnitine CoA-transferase CaiB-like acyl-CoA transferase